MNISYQGKESTRIYVVLHRGAAASGTSLVLCPPFGQEMVNTYPRFARWSKQLTMHGFSVLRYHPYGTGESDGTYVDVTLDSAIRDTLTAQDVARQEFKNGLVGYLGLRFGATISILAAGTQRIDFLVLWCPVLSLRQYFRDLLRCQVTADAVKGSKTRTSQEMIADLEAGRNVDVLGYELSPALYRQMAMVQALPENPPAARILWLARPTDEKAAAPIVECWKTRGSHVDFKVMPETAFWENPGTNVPERFSSATLQWLSNIGD